MSAESVAAKAHRYLAQGRLTLLLVTDDEIRAVCRGSTPDPETGQAVRHRLGWNRADSWWCSCPATGQRCAHLTCLRLVVLRQPERTAHRLPGIYRGGGRS